MKGLVVRVIKNDLPEIARRLPQRAAREVRTSTLNIERGVKKSMEGPKHGRAYGISRITRRATRADVAAGWGEKGERITVGWRFHRASAPGEAPARWHGLLASSIQSAFENAGTVGIVFTNSEYGPYLEYGTRQMAPRPFMGPQADQEASRFLAAISNLENL